MRRARDLKTIIEKKNLGPDSMTSDEEVQKIMTEIIMEELPSDCPDSEFAKEICEFKSAKLMQIQKGGEISMDPSEERKFVDLMMRGMMQRVLEAHKF